MNVKDYRKQVEAELSAGVTPAAAGPPEAAPPQQNWDEAIRRLADPTVAVDVRKEAAQLLQAGTFLGAQFSEYRPRYVAALRTAATDADPELRRSALDVLVNFSDEFARQKLVEGLQGTGEELVPPAAALGLLARDDHLSASAVARELLGKSVDFHTRAQAVRVLGSDPGAKELLSGLMNDKTEFREVRRASAVALRGLDNDAFEKNAREILRDGSDFSDIKATVGGALERAGVRIDIDRTSFDEGSRTEE